MIEFEEGYRVRDLDDNQYVVESRRENKKNETVWTVRAYCGSGAGAARLVLRCMIADEQAKLRDEMTAWFDDRHEKMAAVLALPKKGGG